MFFSLTGDSVRTSLLNEHREVGFKARIGKNLPRTAPTLLDASSLPLI